MRKHFIAALFLLVPALGFTQQTINTFAGTNIHDFYNASPATSAQLNIPDGMFYIPATISITPGGLLYISDVNNYGTRVVNTGTGMITTIAGNGVGGFSGDGMAATASQLNLAVSVRADDSGNVYIADYNNNRIRKVNAAGIISTFAGTGATALSGDSTAATAAQIGNPTNISIDFNHNVYVVETPYNRIRKINTSGIIYPFSGTAYPGYTGDGGPASLAQLDGPQGMAEDQSGNVYIADAYNHCIRKVNASGTISTIVGNGSAGYSGDGFLATAARLNTPFDVAIDGNGNVYIADMLNFCVRKINTSGIISTVAGTGFRGNSGDGGPATGAQLDYPRSVTVDTSGNLYIFSGNLVRMVNPSGIISTVVGNNGYSGDGGSATNARMQNPVGICKDKYGNIYVADSGNHTVRMINDSDLIITTLAGNGISGYSGDGGQATNATLMQPVSVAINIVGDIYISDIAANRVRMIDHSTHIITTVAGNGTPGFSGDGGPATNAQLNQPFGIALDNSQNLYISDNANNAVRRLDAFSHDILTYAGCDSMGYYGDGGPATVAWLNWPSCIAFDASDNLYIADENNNVIRKVAAGSGFIATVFGNGTAGSSGDGGMGTAAELNSPVGIVVDDSGGISCAVAGKIRHIPGTGGPVNVIAGNGEAGMTPNGTIASNAVFNGISGMCLDKAGNLLIADAQNRVIRGLGIAKEGIMKTEENLLSLKIVPNPNAGTFEITGNVGDLDAGKELHISITNIMGQEVYKTSLLVNGNNIDAKVNPGFELKYGIYLCRISGAVTNQTISFIIER